MCSLGQKEGEKTVQHKSRPLQHALQRGFTTGRDLMHLGIETDGCGMGSHPSRPMVRCELLAVGSILVVGCFSIGLLA